MRRVVLGSGLVLLAVLFATLVVDRSGAPRDRSEILLTRALDSHYEMSALPRGTLEVDLDRGCVLLSGQPVVWPTGTTLESAPPTLHLPGGLTAEPGDTVYGGGGHVPRSVIRGSSNVDGDVDSALDCARAGTSVVFFAASGAAMSVSPGMLLKSWVGADDLKRAPLRGTLEIDVDAGCVLLSGRPVVWPAGTQLTTTPAEIRLEDGPTARSGDIVEGRGSSLPAAELARTTQWIEGDLDEALACAPAGTEVAVFRSPGYKMTVSRG